VLIAESDEPTRDAIRRYLLLHGYEVETADSGVECLSKLRRGTPGVVVLDSDLAWGGGDGVLAVMREEPRLARIPVVLTTRAPAIDEERFSLAPPLCILEKPVLLDSLLEGIRAFARGRECGNRRGSGPSKRGWPELEDRS
jgi:DNA-binding response OmpR family regulator